MGMCIVWLTKYIIIIWQPERRQRKENSGKLIGHPSQLQKYSSLQNNEQNKIITISIENLEYELGCVNLTKYKNVVSKNIDIKTDLLHIIMIYYIQNI